MRIRNRTTKQGADQQVLHGVRTHLANIPALYLAGKIFTPAALEARIQQRIAAAGAILAAKAAWQQAVRDYTESDKEGDLVIRDLEHTTIAIFGEDSPKLADFGFSAQRRAVWTEEMHVAAVAKRKATREARHTTGPKAKLAIKGTVEPPPPQFEPTPETTTLTPKGDPHS